MRIEEKVILSLIKSGKSLAVAESCTGGLVSDRLTNIPGCSKVLKAAVVAYSNEAKTRALRVPEDLIRRHGAVCCETAIAMARGAMRAFQSDFGIGITGIAGPGGATKTKPVGLTFIAVSYGEESLCLECHFTGPRRNIKTRAATQALKLLSEFLN